MFLNTVISYLGAWEELNSKHSEDYIEIIKCIEKIHITKNQRKAERSENLRDFRNSWYSSLEELGWSSPKEAGIAGQVKNMLAVKFSIGVHQLSFHSWLFRGINLARKRNICKIPILILPTKEINKEIFGGGISYFENCLRELKELAPLNLDYPFLILGISEQEKPLEMFEISSSIEGYNENVVMNRSIEFPPEYYQAGLGILSYFHKVLKEKFPNTESTVKIIQEGLVVKMIIETRDGDRHIVEKVLEEYDLIIKGKIMPEEYFDSAAQILELKNELRIAQLRIESQSELLAYKENKIEKLLDMISNGLSKQSVPAVHVSPIIKVENAISQQNNIHNEVNSTLETIRDLKNILNSSEDIKLLTDVERTLIETNAGNLKDSKSISKLKEFLENINNVESSASKSIATASEGIQLVKKLAKHYNTIASWCGLPQVPFIK